MPSLYVWYLYVEHANLQNTIAVFSSAEAGLKFLHEKGIYETTSDYKDASFQFAFNQKTARESKLFEYYYDRWGVSLNDDTVYYTMHLKKTRLNRQLTFHYKPVNPVWHYR